jgi:octopine/nopaline transport system permease protein
MPDWGLMWSSLPALLKGVALTLQLTVTVLLIALVLAIPVGLSRTSSAAWLHVPANAYILFFRGTPALVQIALLYFGVAQFAWVRDSLLWPVLREPFWCAVIALGLNGAAYSAQILSGALRNVPKGLVEAGRSLGLSRSATLVTVMLPIAVRSALPAYGNEVILTLKATSLASSITLLELTGTARVLVAETYAPYEIFLSAGAVYLALVFVVTRCFAWLETHAFTDSAAAATLKPLAVELDAH